MTTPLGRVGQEIRQSDEADSTGEAVMEELIAHLKRRGTKKKDVDKMWKETSKGEYEENWSCQAEQMVIKEETAAELAMADKWQE